MLGVVLLYVGIVLISNGFHDDRLVLDAFDGVKTIAD